MESNRQHLLLLYILTSDNLNYIPDQQVHLGQQQQQKKPNLIKYRTHLIIMTLSLTAACVRCHFTASGILCPSLLASLLNYSFQSLCCKVPLSLPGKYKVSHSAHCLRWNAPCDMLSGYKYQICGKKNEKKKRWNFAASRTMCRLGLFVVLCALKPSHSSVVSIQCCCLRPVPLYTTLLWFTAATFSAPPKKKVVWIDIFLYVFFDIYCYIKHY